MQNFHNVAFSMKTSTTVCVAALFLIVACSTLSLRRVFDRLTRTAGPRYCPASVTYEDEDGAATPESQIAYSYQMPRVLALLLSVVGFLGALTLCIITTQASCSMPGVELWLQFAGWVTFDALRRNRFIANVAIRLSSSYKQ